MRLRADIHSPQLTRYRGAVLYDFGGKDLEAVKSAAHNVPRTLDLLILSHFDYDHVNGLPELKALGVGIRRVWFPRFATNVKIATMIRASVEGSNSGAPAFRTGEIARLISNPAAYFAEWPASVVECDGELPASRDGIRPPEGPDTTDPGVGSSLGGAERPFELVFSPSRTIAWLRAQGLEIFELRVVRNGSLDASTEKIEHLVEKACALFGLTPEKIMATPTRIVSILSHRENQRKLHAAYADAYGEINNSSLAVLVRQLLAPGSRTHIHAGAFRGNGRSGPAGSDWPPSPNSPHLVPDDQHNILLFTGDLEKPILNKVVGVSSIAVQVPHHGGRSSLSSAFYRQNPFWVGLISHPEKSADHPHAEVLAELSRWGMQVVHATEQSGGCFWFESQEIY